MLTRVLIAGAGRIGSLIANLLATSGDYQVSLLDASAEQLELNSAAPHLILQQLNVTDTAAMTQFLQTSPQDAVVSCLPYFCNFAIASLAKQFHLHYFDLTEDVTSTGKIKQLAQQQKQAFAPGCGLAPGFVNIVAQSLMQNFTELQDVKLRVGCLPVVTDNALHYALTWSTDGLINEYGNVCSAIVAGKLVELQPLENYELVEVDGVEYEAFNTSGGIGTLTETYLGKVKNLNYKTLRYPGHCEKIRFLMKDLKLNEDRETLKRILENALPRITQDVAIIYVAVSGKKENKLQEEFHVNKIYPQVLFDKKWSAIQVTTASSASAVIDIVLQNASKYHGFILQEQIPFNLFLQNRFGKIFAEK